MFVPTGNRVAIRLDEVSGRTEGGLYTPQTAELDGPKRGEVMAVSDGYMVNGHPMKSVFKRGDRVFVDTLGACKVRHDSTDYVIVRNEDIVAIVGQLEA